MCQCGTNKNTTPGAGNGGQQAVPVVQVCPGFQSSVLVIDELGLPMQNTNVKIAVDGGAPQAFVTDSLGRVCFHKPPGTTAVVEASDTHEGSPGESTTTSSSKHFGHLKPGP